MNEWDQDSTDALEDADSILEQNQEAMDRISELDLLMTSEELHVFSEVNQDALIGIIEKQKELIKVIKNESKHLTNQLAQINQKSNVVNHYMNKEKSLFIDKDM